MTEPSVTDRFPEPEHVRVGDINLAVYRMGPDPDKVDKPTLLFLHGFPEIAYSWRHVMAAMAREGYPVVAFDMRGYGASDVPDAIEAYGAAQLVGDVVGLADALNLDNVVAIGHDWGALILWMLPFWVPGRFKAYAGLNVALTPHFPMDPIALFRARLGDNMYIVRFQEPGVAEAILERDVEASIRYFLRKPARFRPATLRTEELAFAAKGLDLLALFEAGPSAWGGEPLMEDDDIARYVAAFQRTGFAGPINYYRNMTANWTEQKQFLIDGKLPIIQEPVLMITADLDHACPAWLADGMVDMCTNLSRTDLQSCGHWSMQEQPHAIIKSLSEWLNFNVVNE